MLLTSLMNSTFAYLLSTSDLVHFYSFVIQLRPILSSCLSITIEFYSTLTTLSSHVTNTSTLPAWLSQLNPTGGQIVISFLPEITLAVMITYLLGVVAVELARNRAPKVLAIEC